eukprot:c29079_g1_i1 orf=338-2992(-)
MDPSVKQDLAKLHKDPHSRRSALKALKGYVELLDSKTMPSFLDQVSDAKENEASRPHAISLFVDVARVHRMSVVPFLPRIMCALVGSLSASAGSRQLQQACSNVVASVAKYTVDSTVSSSQNGEILRALCDPLLAVLCSKLEPLASGAALCLRALVESEKWKFAPVELVDKLCFRVSAALGEKCTQTVAHMQLARSLAKFNTDEMQNYTAKILRSGAGILRTAGASWQCRVSAAQLLSSMFMAADEETLSSELGRTSEALQSCRFDSVQLVRSAVSDALNTAKSLGSEKELIQINDGEGSVVSSRDSDAGKRGRRGSSLCKAEGLFLQSKYGLSGSQERQAKCTPSPVHSYSSLDSAFLSSPSSVVSSARTKRSPLFPAKQVFVKAAASEARASLPSNLDQLFAHFGSSEMKENAPASRKLGIPSDMEPLNGLTDGAVAKGPDPPSLDCYDLKEDEESLDFCGGFSLSGDFLFGGEGGNGDILSEDNKGDLSFRNGATEIGHAQCLNSVLGVEDHTVRPECKHTNNFGNDGYSEGPRDALGRAFSCSCMQGSIRSLRNGELDGVLKEGDSDRSGNSFENEKNIDSVNYGCEDKGSRTGCAENETSSEFFDPLLACNSRYNSLAHLVNLEEAMSPQRAAGQMAAEDILLFATPRKLVHSLQSGCLTPESRGTPVYGGEDDIDLDSETLSESGWSVRHNPIAGDGDDALDGSMFCSISQTKSYSCTSVDDSEENGGTSMQVQRKAFLCEREVTADSSALASDSLFEGEESRIYDSSNSIDSSNFGMIGMTVSGKHGTDRVVTEGSGTSLGIGMLKCSATRKRGFSNWLVCVCDRSWSVVSRGSSRVLGLAEMFLGTSLCLVLILLIIIVVMKCLNREQEFHILVPT